MFKGHVIGNLTKDPELRETNGRKWLTFSIGTRTSTKDRESGEYISNFIDGSLSYGAENLAGRLRKGDRIYAEGDCAMVAYKTREGKEGTSLRMNNAYVEVLRCKLDDEARAAGKTAGAAKPQKPAPQPVDVDEDLPF